MKQVKTNNYTIVGTDTHVGKTVVALVLMKYLCKKGYHPLYLKPLQTGCLTTEDTDSDARFVYSHLPELKNEALADHVIHCFQPAKAPWFAARDQNTDINSHDLIDEIHTRNDHSRPCVIEAAGGLMVPINQKTLFIDLLPQIESQTILVARAGLGTINHSLLSIEALLNRNIIPAGIVLSKATSVSDTMVKENIEAIKAFSDVYVLGVLERIDTFDHIPDHYMAIFDKGDHHEE